MNLAELQNNFKNFIFNNHHNELYNYVVPNNLNAQQRLQIYRNNIFINLHETMLAYYPKINKIVGDEYFKGLINQFVIQYPPSSSNLQDYGNQFANFLENFPPVQILPYLSEMARLEWACHEVFFEEDSNAIDFSLLKNIADQDYQNIKFELNKAARLLLSQFPILRIWELCETEENTTVDLAEGGEHILVLRNHAEVFFKKLSVGEFFWLSALEKKLNFLTACQEAFCHEANLNINTILQEHITLGTIINFSL